MKPSAYIVIDADGREEVFKADIAEYYMKHFPTRYEFIPLFRKEETADEIRDRLTCFKGELK